MRNKIRIAIISAEDPADRKGWSGIPYFISRALQEGGDEVVLLGPFSNPELPLRIASSLTFRLSKGINWLIKKFTNSRRYNYDDSLTVGVIFARFFEKKLQEQEPFDLIIAPASITAISQIKTAVPIFNVGDATFKLLNGYYPYISNLVSISRFETYTTEKLALHNSTLNIYSSEWAADSAVKDYQVPTTKIKVIPFEANIEVAPSKAEVQKTNFSFKLLFLGVDWLRKGGPIAFECLTTLRGTGLDVELIVCGCVPPPEFQNPHVQVIPFLDKNKPESYNLFVNLLADSDFLLLPTRADCTPVAFCEAAAYGLPSITTDTGGIRGIIEEGVNGYMLPLAAVGKDYANLIARLYADKEAYLQLCLSTRAKYERELNWSVWSKKVKELFLGI